MPQAVGQLMASLACAGSGLAVPDLDYAGTHYSHDLVRLRRVLRGFALVFGSVAWLYALHH